MAKSVKVNRKRSRPGRPATGRDPVSAVRLPEVITGEIDRWAASQKISRSEAIRKLVVVGLKTVRFKRPISEKAAAKASAMASETLDRIIDKSASAEERATQKAASPEGAERSSVVRLVEFPVKITVALAWLDPKDWSQWQEIDPSLPPYDEWVMKVEARHREAFQRGVQFEIVRLYPDLFASWCKAKGCAPGEAARAEYATAAFAKRPR